MKFTWVHVLCLAVVGASAQSFDSGLRLNVKGRCGDGFGIQTPVIETSRIRMPNFVGSAIAHQACDCVKTVVRPQMKKEIVAIPTVRRFFQTPSNSIFQTIPFVAARNVRVPAFPLPSLKMFAEILPAPVVGTRNGFFSGAAVNIARPVCGLDGNFQGVLNGAFLGNSLGAAAELVSSFPGTVGADFNARGNGVVIPRSSVVGGGFASRELRNCC